MTQRWEVTNRPIAKALRRGALRLSGLVVLAAGLQTAYRDAVVAHAEQRRQSEADARLSRTSGVQVPVVVQRKIDHDEHANPYPSSYKMIGVHTRCQPGNVLDIDPITPLWCSWSVVDIEDLAHSLSKCPSEQGIREDEVQCWRGAAWVHQDGQDVSFGRYSGVSGKMSWIERLVIKNIFVALAAFSVALVSSIATLFVLQSIYGNLGPDKD